MRLLIVLYFSIGMVLSSAQEQPDVTIELVYVEVPTGGYYIGRYEVTQGQWDAVMDTSFSKMAKSDDHPVDNVNWYDAIRYCNALSKAEGRAPFYRMEEVDNSDDVFATEEYIVTCNWKADGYRLPTEMEWEYAARGGNKSKDYKYAGSDNLPEVAWYERNALEKGRNHQDYGTHPVGQKKANELGIYDMSGNVWEWCWDVYEKTYKYTTPSTDLLENIETAPKGRVIRGGSWGSTGTTCRLGYKRGRNHTGRSYMQEYETSRNMGFRVILPAYNE